MDNILNKRLQLPNTLDTVCVRQHKFLEKVAKLPTTRLTRLVINSIAIPKEGVKLQSGPWNSLKVTLRKAMERTKVLAPGSGGPLKTWIPKLRSPDIGETIEKELGLPEGSYSQRKRRKKLN